MRELEKVAQEMGDEETRVSVWQGGDGESVETILEDSENDLHFAVEY